MRQGGGPPSLELLAQIQGRLPLHLWQRRSPIPKEERRVIESSLKNNSDMRNRFQYLALISADHGFMCEERSSFKPEASSQGWQLLLEGY